MRITPAVGANIAVVFGGKPAQAATGRGAAGTPSRRDEPHVVYTNPWTEGRVRTVAISDLANHASGTSADFETIIF